MKIKNEDEILDIGTRKRIISEIKGPENEQRKRLELRKHEIYRDQTRKWVVYALMREGFKPTTIAQMENRAPNVSICKKITNKLATTYVGGVQRTVKDAQSQKSIDALADELDINTVLKKSDRYRQLFKNTLIQVVGRISVRESEGEEYKHDLGTKVLAPWEYDVVEDCYDPTKAMIVVLTDFPERRDYAYNTIQGADGIRAGSPRIQNEGDGTDQAIADSPADKGIEKREFIWWSSKYHFTTDENGVIVKAPNPDAGEASVALANPIGMLPFVDLHGDQDGAYWATGGEDVIDMSVLVNKELTDANYITFNQGWGQLVVSGKDLPKKLVGGPDNAFVLEQQEGDPTPQVFYATSNPPIEAWMNKIKMQLAMLLSTNGLSPRLVSASLDSTDVVSGISRMIEDSEVTVNNQDVQTLYQDKEPELWEIIRRWHEVYSQASALTERFQAIPTFKDSNVNLKFNQIKPIISEKEQLEVLQLRKDLGLDTQADLLRKDNPDLTEAEAKAKALAIDEEKKKRAEEFAKGMVEEGDDRGNGKFEDDEDEEKAPPTKA